MSAPLSASSVPHQQRETINGGWHLDISRSETMRGYLQAMDCSEIAIEAMEKAEKEVSTIHIITLTPTHYLISKKSRVNSIKETYTLNKEESTSIAISKDGKQRKTKNTYVSTYAGPNGAQKPKNQEGTFINVRSTMPTTNGVAEVCDFRILEASEDGGGVNLYQELRLKNLSTGKECLTKRWFFPVDAIWIEDEVGGEDEGKGDD